MRRLAHNSAATPAPSRSNTALFREVSKIASEGFQEPLDMDLPESEYLVSKTFEVVTPESAQDGDTADSGFVFQNQQMEESDIVNELQEYSQPSASYLGGLRWVSTEPEQDYTDGSYTTYSLHISNLDGSEIDSDVWEDLLKKAGVFQGMHLSSVPPDPNELRVDTWFERDRASIVVYQGDKEIAEWWDDAVREMIEDGFFDPRNLEQSVIEYCREHGMGHTASVETCDDCGAPATTILRKGGVVTDQFCDACYRKGSQDTESDFSHFNDTTHRWASASCESESCLEPATKDGYCADCHPQHTTGGHEAALLEYDKSGDPPNTSTATSDHADELKLLAAQLQAFKR